MKVDISQPILNFEGEPLKIQGTNDDLTYGFVFRNLLGGAQEKDSGENRLKKFELGLKCVADDVELSLDEAKMIKDLAAESKLNNLVYGRICQLLEGDKD